ncbi:AC2 protein [Clerodendrum golden mosaic Jiangsu virus]|uniref:Transcriptional activator protein n=1 Tax=Clerodendrum golden mosaic Jiangsu virus TaxID=649509 RepID=C5J9I6_9GEMI|nr:AC2 protein [Clerodendrum golden mosaic Jiangsu virus]CAZ40065.1 AC2 protein [Clerodendrum golden mosaic Jiangsu virus]
MQHSSPSRSHYTPIKVIHKQAKRPIRRKRIDLACGCSIYKSVDCEHHGFTHRGVHHCSSSDEWRTYMGYRQSPLFQDPKPPQETVQHEPRHHTNSSPIQPQPKEGVGDSQVFSQLEDLHSFTSSDIAFLKGI